MALIIVEAVPAGIKPPAADDSMRTSTSGKQGFGASAPSLTRASPMQFSEPKRGSTVLPKQAAEISPCFIPSAAAPSVRLSVFASASTSPSLARLGC